MGTVKKILTLTTLIGLIIVIGTNGKSGFGFVLLFAGGFMYWVILMEEITVKNFNALKKKKECKKSDQL